MIETLLATTLLATSEDSAPPFELDADYGDQVIEVEAELTLPSDELRDGSRAGEVTNRADNPTERSNPGGGTNPPSNHRGQPGPRRGDGGNAEGGVIPGNQESSSHYCGAFSWTVDTDCQSIINRMASPEPCVVTGEVAAQLGQSTLAPVCLDETPEPVQDEEVVEAAVEAPEDDEPDITVILEQIPGLVAEEFTTLPIDGGSVQFEEDLLGFGFINRHTNVFADVEDQSFQRDMLGIDVEIRAVPVDYHFDYGDGATRTTASPGTSAADQAAASGSALTDVETPTSHVYQETGLYDVDLTTTFTGEYRIAGGTWTPIADSTTVAASPGQADIWRTQARHVSGQCEDHAQWGCNGPFTIEGDDRPPEVFADQYDDAGNWRGP